MAKAFVPKEIAADETRVAATPETCAKLARAGLEVLVQEGAGEASSFDDESYRAAGARMVASARAGYAEADLVLKVREPETGPEGDEIGMLKKGAILVSFLVPQSRPADIRRLADLGISVLSMNLVPRISRAQSMDALSSQANIAGYKAVLLAAAALPRYFPQFMTAAGTVKPAKVVVMGAGVAGLQAIATARRLGAVVWASDVRLAVKEQVQSLGGKFIEIPGMEDLQDERGYAREASPEFLERQRQIIGEHVASADAVITTAQIPGRKAPVLLPTEMVKRMRRGSVVVDLAAEQGGNCAETVPGESVVRHGVTILGPRNVPGSVPYHASELYARNVLNLVMLMLKDGGLRFNLDDEVIAGSAVTHAGEVRHAPTASLLAQGVAR